MPEEETERGKNSNIELLMGDYRTSFLKLAWPMILSMALTMLYNLVDSIWVAGLGADALAALGFTAPLYMILVALGNGIGVGANSVIARYIGAKDHFTASNAAVHSLVLAIIVSIAGAILMYFILSPVLELMGASGANLEYGVEYGRVIFTLMIAFVYMNVSTGILRGEGDVKRAMYVMVATGILNIILDPIFIYGFNLGIVGAAWTTVFSATISCIVLLYWTLIKKDTYVQISFRGFSFDRSLLYKILNVAIPSTAEVIIVSALGITINYILALTSGAAAVAVYTVNFRLIQMGMIPLSGFGQALLTLTGASFGSKRFKRLQDTYFYAIEIGFIAGVAISLVLYFGAPYICQVFAYSESAELLPQMVDALHIFCFWLVGASFGILGAMLFQGLGKGFTSLTLTFIRMYLLQVLFSWIFAVTFSFADYGVYFGMVLGCLAGGLINFSYASYYVRKQRREHENDASVS